MSANRNGFLTVMVCAPPLLLLLLLGPAVMQTCEGSSSFPWPLKKRHVLLQNDIHGRKLHVHCKSADDDLGVHVLRYKQQYEWQFKVNFFSTTLYHCHLWWDRGQMSVEVYDAERTLYDSCGPGNVCKWLVHEFGASLYDAVHDRWMFMSHWDEPRSKSN